VTLSLPSGEHTVVQLEAGDQSESLKALAAEIAATAAGGADLVTIGSLDEGLARVADGGLAPEALRVAVHFKPTAGDGWLFSARDGVLRSQPFSAQTGYADEYRHVARDRIRALARRLHQDGVAYWRTRIPAAEYTELRVQVLDQRLEILARPLAGASPASAAEVRALQSLRRDITALHRFTIEQGQRKPSS
jgi:hypothetical protein